ncbi:hypothetical protein BOW37_05190, partial [Solemya velum gill symbiont]|uniref:hypothetical protein n=1 Tax=Solemya velum gill symbiont TaxID=2340 RepID=UPI0009D54316
LDDLFRFVSLDSHFWSSVFLIIRVDQLIGGGSVEYYYFRNYYIERHADPRKKVPARAAGTNYWRSASNDGNIG